jgi:hypothetical protein
VYQTQDLIVVKVEEIHTRKRSLLVSRIKDVKIKSIKARYSLLFKKTTQ